MAQIRNIHGMDTMSYNKSIQDPRNRTLYPGRLTPGYQDFAVSSVRRTDR